MTPHKVAPSRFDPQKATTLEATTGHVATEAGLTVAATFVAASVSGGAALLLPLLPVLTKSLAAGRQEVRIKANLESIQRVLLEHEAALVRISDEQYALVNEILLAAMASTNDTKLGYLRNAIRNALALSELRSQEAVVLGRVVRDISADEARFVMNHYRDGRRVSISRESTSSPDHHVIDPDSDEALCVFGLLSVGVLTPGNAMFEAMGLLGFSQLAPALVSLLSESPG